MPSTALNRTGVVVLTNKSGGALTYGAVVIQDTANASAFTTTTTAGLSTRQVGVILEPNGIANNAAGLVAFGCYVPILNLNTAATVGQLIKTHTVAGQGTPHSSPQVEGDFAVALTASATPEAILFGSPNGPASGGAGTVTTTGSPASGQSVKFSGATSITSVAAPAVCEGRLTTESGVPVSTSDRTAQGTIYWKPCTPSGRAKTNGQIALYDGTTAVLVSVTEITKALTITSGKNKNIYIDYNAGTPQIILGADWTNDTTESETLVDQNGLIVLSGTPAYRYVGVIRASGANVTEQSKAHQFVWNEYNQVPLFLSRQDSTDTWTWNSATWHQANASASNQVDYVCGVSHLVRASVSGQANGATGTAGAVGVGVDVTNANSAQVFNESNAGINNGNWPAFAIYRGYPGKGYHFLAWLEYARAGTVTFQGDGAVADEASGILAEIMG